jgi:hypothetical protein
MLELAGRDAPTRAIARAAEPPVRISLRRIPPAGPPTVHHAAVENPPERPLKVVVLRRRRAVTFGIEAHHELVAPVPGGVGQQRDDVDAFRDREQPYRCGPLTGPDSELW